MASLSAASLLALSSLICHLAASSAVLTARPGEDVTLSCQAPDVNIEAAEWTRPDLNKEEYVFFYRDGRIESDYQHPFFKNRVELKDKEMKSGDLSVILKNGDLSVILKNVKEEDSGTYECRIKAAGAKHRKRAIIDGAPISIIQLEVVNPVQKEKTGDDVTLSCQAPDDVDITVAEWRRSDLKKEPLFLYQDGRVDSVYRHPSFKNRVQLKDKEMKNGDLSVILKNVTEEDSGTYECHFKAADAKRMKRAIIKIDPISTIRLTIVDPDPGHSNGPAGLVYPAVVGVLVLAQLIVSVFAVVMYRKQKAYGRELKKNGLVN